MASIYSHIAIIIGLFVAGFGSGFVLENRLKSTEIAELKAAQATEKEKATSAALSDLRATSAAIHQAAMNYTDSTNDLKGKINAIRIEIKKARPLAPDCKPGDVRLFNVNAAIKQSNSSTP